MSPKVVMEMEGGEGTDRVRNRVWGPPHRLDVSIGSETVKNEVEVVPEEGQSAVRTWTAARASCGELLPSLDRVGHRWG